MTMKAEIYKSDDGKATMKSLISPAEYQSRTEARREMMIDAIVVETDDDIKDEDIGR